MSDDKKSTYVEPGEIESATKFDQAVSVIDFILQRWAGLTAFGVLGIITFVVGSYFGIPEWIKTLALGTILTAIVVVPASIKIIDWITTDTRQVLLEIDAAKFWETRLWILPKDKFREMDVTEGKMYRTPNNIPIVRSYNPDTNTATGPWMGALTDIDLASSREAILGNRGRILKWAIYGHKMEAQMDTIVANIEAEIWSKNVDEELESIHGEEVKDIVRKTIENETGHGRLSDSLESIPEPPEEKVMEVDDDGGVTIKSDGTDAAQSAGDEQ